jgi:uncharacterized protein
MKIKMILCLVAVMCAGACASTPGSRFYMLNAIQKSAQVSHGADQPAAVSLCIGPVLVPAYLDRMPLCVRDSGYEVRYAEYHRWAEPLESALTRVLAENLSVLLGTVSIDVFPWKTPAPADYQVRIMIIRFDGEPGGQAVLKARWSITAAGQEKPVCESISAYVEQVDSRKYEALVAAQSRALERLSREIAAAIQAQQP